MMATTHVLAGLALASAVSVFAPEAALAAALGGALGGLVPDLDIYWGHRKTLHFPVYFSALAIPAALLAILSPTTLSIGVGTFLAAAALHSVGDVFGGGLELRPWLGTSDRAVYDHSRGRWLAPRRWIRYDGAPEDLGLAILLAIPTIVVFGGLVETLALLSLGISALYVTVRKPLAWVSEQLPHVVPPEVQAYLPERMLSP